MFPNRHSVYLHDTPSRSLFARSRRLFSSGCMRVEHPWKLAELILDNPRHWSRARLKRIVATGRTRQIRLDKPLTIILAYWTAIGDKDGKVSFRKDIYARDAAVLWRTLNRGGQLRIMHSQPVRSEAAVSAPL